MKKRLSPEADLQEAIVSYVKHQYPHVIIFAIPNGGKRGYGDQAEKKRTGILAGVPDLFVAHIRYKETADQIFITGGLFLEVKAGKRGIVSIEQNELMAKIEKSYYSCKIVRDIDSAIKIIDSYLK